MRNHASHKHRAGDNAVVTAVRSGSDERLRIYAPSYAAVEYHHSELDRDRNQHHHHRNHGELHLLRRNDAFYSAFEEFYADNDNENSDHEP